LLKDGEAFFRVLRAEVMEGDAGDYLLSSGQIFKCLMTAPA
jgi:hypothetical protein